MDFTKEYLFFQTEHDAKACQALEEYENSFGKKTARLMVKIAEKHGTTTERMKEHWKCIGL